MDINEFLNGYRAACKHEGYYLDIDDKGYFHSSKEEDDDRDNEYDDD